MFLKNIIYLLMIGILSTANAGNIEGFRGLKWGDSSSKLNNKQEIEEEVYKLQNENLAIDKGMATEIGYTFFKDKFYGVRISFVGVLNYESITRAIHLKYDIDENCNNFKEHISCYGKDKKGNVYSSEYQIADPGYGTIRMWNTKIFNEVEKHLEKESKKYSGEVKGL